MSGVPYSPLTIDMNFSSIAKVLHEFVKPTDRKLLLSLIESVLIKPDDENTKLIVTFCERTAYDLLLQVLAWPPGSEIIMTCINIPHMAQIARYHNLKVIPVEIRKGDLSPDPRDIEKAITPNTKAIMVVYVFGTGFNIDPIVSISKKHNLMLIEDSAELFYDVNNIGHPEADITLFSFGSIKVASSLGGGLAVIRNNESLYRKMKIMHNAYPTISNYFYLKRMAKASAAVAALNWGSLNNSGRAILNKLGIEYKDRMISLLRGFAPGQDFLKTFRYQPPTPMLAMLYLRLSTFNRSFYKRVEAKCLDGSNQLVGGGIEVPGGEADSTHRHFWLFPILVPDVELCEKILEFKGIDAFKGVSPLSLVESPIGSKYAYPTKTLSYFKNLLFLPIHKETSEKEIFQVVKRTIEVVKIVERIAGKNSKPIQQKL